MARPPGFLSFLKMVFLLFLFRFGGVLLFFFFVGGRAAPCNLLGGASYFIWGYLLVMILHVQQDLCFLLVTIQHVYDDSVFSTIDKYNRSALFINIYSYDNIILFLYVGAILQRTGAKV